MSKIITKEMVSSLFINKKFDNDVERIVYSEAFINAEKDTVEHDLYELVSDIAGESALSFDFSYDIMSRACDVLTDLSLWDGDEIDSDDGLHEAIDNAVPVYTHDLLKIVNANDYDLVDVALQNGEGSIIQACQMAWYDAITDAVHAIHDAITEYNNNNA